MIAGTLLFLNDQFVVESIYVNSSSMEPAILPNERLLVQKLGYSTINRFDVVVIDAPRLGKRLVKRVVGLPGETVRLEDGWRLFINGQSLEYSAETGFDRIEAGDHRIHLDFGGEKFATSVAKTDLLLGPGEFFVLGDHRTNSEDSRAFGPVQGEEIVGQVWRVWYSFDLKERRVRWDRIGAR